MYDFNKNYILVRNLAFCLHKCNILCYPKLIYFLTINTLQNRHDACLAINRRKYSPNKTYIMKLSARNQLKGKILKVDEGLITAKVTLDLGNGNIISAIISKDAIADLNLKPGDDAFAVIKSTEVIIGIPCECKDGHCNCK